jgi:hypothetical protein
MVSSATRAHIAPDTLGLLSMKRRDARGIIGVWGWGTWTPDYTQHHFAILGRHIADVRAAGHPVRVLVNLRKAAVQPAEAIAVIRAGTDAIYKPGDRIALLVGSSLIKAQMGQLLDRAKLNFFLSETAAHMWLSPDLAWPHDQARWQA